MVEPLEPAPSLKTELDSVSGSLMPEDSEPNAAPCRWLLPSHIHLGPASLTCQSHDVAS